MHLPHLSIDKASDQLFVMDRQARIVNVNESACQTLGFQRRELLSMSFADIDAFVSIEVWEKLWAELDTNQTLQFESEHRIKNGSLIPVGIQSRLITLDGRKYVCSIVKQLTGQHRETPEHQEINERFRILFEYAAVGMARVSLNGEFLQVNDAFCRMVGYSREEILAKTITYQQLTHPEDILPSLDRHQQLLSGQIPSFSLMKRCVSKRGAMIWVNLSVSLLRDSEGGPLYFIGTALDITDSKRKEESQNLAAAVLAHTHDGIFITDLQGRIRQVNPAFVELTGFEEREVLGQTAQALQADLHPEGFVESVWRSLKSKGHWRGEIWGRHKNGKLHPLLMTISAIKDHSSETTGYVAVFSDISKIKESEAQLQFLAHHDPLTGLPNRRLLELRVEHALEIASRNRQPMGILMIDLDHFKAVNDRLGHAAGDELLTVVGLRLSKRLRQMDTLARLGGDEFAVLLETPVDREAAGQVAQALLAELSAPVSLTCGQAIRVEASIGISLFPDHGDRYSGLMQRADAALYQAKNQGRNTFRYFSDL